MAPSFRAAYRPPCLLLAFLFSVCASVPHLEAKLRAQRLGRQAFGSIGPFRRTCSLVERDVGHVVEQGDLPGLLEDVVAFLLIGLLQRLLGELVDLRVAIAAD